MQVLDFGRSLKQFRICALENREPNFAMAALRIVHIQYMLACVMQEDVLYATRLLLCVDACRLMA